MWQSTLSGIIDNIRSRPGFAAITIIDVVIASLIIYQIVKMLAGTRAISILKGLILIVILRYSTGKLGLVMVSSLFDRLMTMLTVALPILFYPELRRGLEELGRGQIIMSRAWSIGKGPISPETVEEVAKATARLSADRTGALIVIEKDHKLTDVAETGTPIDALVSSELLLNIFTKNTPLHDGACILRGDRLIAAGCFLPLSDSPKLARELGTRHRAAVGISEESDAVVVAVSEETGIISLAYHGELERGLARETLKRELCHLFGLPSKGERGRFWARFQG